MKISLNTIRYIDQHYGCAGDPAPEGVEKLVARIGAQLGGVEEVMHIGKKYDGVLIVKVVSCEDHPDADRLHVCMIDDGGAAQDVERSEDGLVQVVCGAPNVHAGVTVAWLPPGSTVPSSYDDDPFVLEARKLRGVVSNGMLASPKELAIGDSHEGLLIIDEEVKPGTPFADHFNLKDDVVVDIENKMFTHRPDCFGWLGVAREIAGIQGQAFTSPEWYRSDIEIAEPEAVTLPMEVRNEIPELVPRFTAVTMSDIQISPSPVWLQVELAKVGLRPINNIVDLTNYHMLVTGQPLHAYDYDKVRALDGGDKATIVVRNPHAGEKLTLLNGKEVEPRPEAILIASETQAIGLGGVMGGGNTEVDENTTNIILECASFDMYSIRKTSMANGIFTDAVTRFNKGQSPLQNMAVLAKIVDDIENVCGGKIAGETIDKNNLPIGVIDRDSLHEPVKTTPDFINARLGLKLSAEEMFTILENVEFKVGWDGIEPQDGESGTMAVTAPFWRTDIEIPEDIVEEVGRLYGFDKLPAELPRRAIIPAKRNAAFDLKQEVRRLLSAAGANEVLTYSFVHGNALEAAGQDKEKAFKLGNALSPDLQYYRLSLTPSLLELVNPNIRAGHDEFVLYEMGKTHFKGEWDDAEPDIPNEDSLIAVVIATSDRQKPQGSPYYQARKYLEYLDKSVVDKLVPMTEFNFDEDEWGRQLAAPYEPKRAALIVRDGQVWGVVGEFKASLQRTLKLPQFAAGFEVHMDALSQRQADGYDPLPKYPQVEQDISLKVSADLTYQNVYQVVWQKLQEAQPDTVISSLAPLDIYQSTDDMEHKNITLRFTIASYEKTLKTEEVNSLLDQAAEAAKENLGAERL